jgi:hypothetical protein
MGLLMRLILEDFFNKKIIEGNEGNLKINIIINNILK